MNSFGILYTLKNGNEPRAGGSLTAELHTNYWKIPLKHGKYERFVDLGIYINDVARDVSTISFYLPFKITKSDISDLGNKLKDSNLLCTLFNGEYSIQNIANSPSYYSVKSRNDDHRTFWLYILGDNNFEIKEVSPIGCLVNVKILSLPKIDVGIRPADNEKPKKRNLYFRFRIRNIPNNCFFYEESISNDFLQSAFSKTEMIDFRVNEIREIDPKALEYITKDKNFVMFNKIHFYFVGSSEEEQIVGASDYNDCRILNQEKWNPYIDESVTTRHLMAYHWKWKGENGQTHQKYNVFVKTIYKSIQGWSVLKYCGVVFFINLLAAAAWCFISFLFF